MVLVKVNWPRHNRILHLRRLSIGAYNGDASPNHHEKSSLRERNTQSIT
jgi:hypothetical protein